MASAAFSAPFVPPRDPQKSWISLASGKIGRKRTAERRMTGRGMGQIFPESGNGLQGSVEKCSYARDKTCKKIEK